MNVGSLFSGVGGFDLGLERAGHRIVFQCEKDEWCRGILAQHWPGVPCYEDVRDVVPAPRRRAGRNGADTIGRCRGQRAAPRRRDGDREGRELHIGDGQATVDLLCGGFPCQDLSVAGRRAGLAGERSGLFFEFARVADDLVRPGGWLLIENVPGLLSSAGGRDFAVLLRTLGDIGFHDLAWRVLDSRYFGVPQRRRRVYILGRRASGDRARAVLLEPESGGGDFAPGSQARARVAASLASGAHRAGVSPPGRRQHDDENIVNALDRKSGGADDNDAQAGHLVGVVGREERDRDGRDGEDADGRRAPELQPQQPADHQQEVAPAIVKRYAKGTDSDATDALIAGTVRTHMRAGSNDTGGIVAHTLRAEGFDASEDGTGRGTPLTVAGPLGGGNDGAGRRSEDDPNLVVPGCHGVLGEQPGRGRREPDRDVDQDGRREGGPELPGGTDRVDGAPADAHRVRAPAELPGPMDGALDPKPDGPRYAAMGNAVTVNVAHWIGLRLAVEQAEAVA